jgi:putative FmdB family regulatory protein
MPIYEYECLSCHNRSEAIQKLNDPPLATCRDCGGELKKLISAPAIQFKGDGWYVTDYKDKDGKDKDRSKQDGGTDSSDKKDGGDKSESGKSESGKKDGGGSEAKTSESKSSGDAKSSGSSPAKTGGGTKAERTQG